jgi:hypothetical protein
MHWHAGDLYLVAVFGHGPSCFERYPCPGFQSAGMTALGNFDAIDHNEDVVAVADDYGVGH